MLNRPTPANAFHEGERAIQQLAGVDDEWSAMASGAIRSFMPDQHREFFAHLPFVVAGAIDDSGQPWATLLEGAPGFIQSPDSRHLHFNTQLPDVDPISSLLRRHSKLALLGIEPRTRRRNRANGIIDAADKQGLDVEVLQSFGNCPKYIQARTVEYVADSVVNPSAQRSSQLSEAARQLISAADTFFIASAYSSSPENIPAHGVDVSHRGGRPGFVRIEGDALSIHDFVGNNYFNTLGNLKTHPFAGLLFVDFTAGATLHIAARARLEWLAPSTPRDRIETNRIVHFDISDVVLVTHRSRLRWGEATMSPFLR
jgi:predicted pyridoxine 5'-phosphate oxidase superfamily flavin-nucleotide-binding protein